MPPNTAPSAQADARRGEDTRRVAVAGSVLGPVRGTFRELARAILPETGELDDAGWGRLEAIVEAALKNRPARLKRQLRFFVRILGWLPMLRRGRPFRALPDAMRTKFLVGVERSRSTLIRTGFWGLRTLVLMGYYGQDEVRRSIGYGASPTGWKTRPPVLSVRTPPDPGPSS